MRCDSDIMFIFNYYQHPNKLDTRSNHWTRNGLNFFPRQDLITAYLCCRKWTSSLSLKKFTCYACFINNVVLIYKVFHKNSFSVNISSKQFMYVCMNNFCAVYFINPSRISSSQLDFFYFPPIPILFNIYVWALHSHPHLISSWGSYKILVLAVSQRILHLVLKASHLEQW